MRFAREKQEAKKHRLTVEKLKNYGANTEEGLTRCMNNEAFYLKLVRMGLADSHFAGLRDAVAAGDVKKAFEDAHALKGVCGNLALKPILDPVSELTEKLRGQETMPDVKDLADRITEQLEKARALDA